MQTFKDTATDQSWAFEDDVQVVRKGKSYSFKTRDGTPLDVPGTLVPHTPPKEDPLVRAKEGLRIAAHKAFIRDSHRPVEFTTAAGVKTAFGTGGLDWDLCFMAYMQYVVHGAPLPKGFSLFDTGGHAVEVTLSDLTGVFGLALAQIQAAGILRAGLLERIDAAVDATAVKAIVI